MGVHSRLRGLHDRIRDEALVGNLYINRDTVGAVVGSHPFGGHGASGTGPKGGWAELLKAFGQRAHCDRQHNGPWGQHGTVQSRVTAFNYHALHSRAVRAANADKMHLTIN